jgi:hypothetical protein
MRSGYVDTHRSVPEFEPGNTALPDPLMGLSGGTDTHAQSLRQKFETRDEAIAYADSVGLHYEVELHHQRRMKPKAHADNCLFGRAENWTH